MMSKQVFPYMSAGGFPFAIFGFLYFPVIADR